MHPICAQPSAWRWSSPLEQLCLSPHLQYHDLAPIFYFLPPPQVIPTTPSPPVTQPARAQQAPVRCQSPASIPLPPSPPPMDICPPSPPRPTLAHIMPQSDIPSLVDTYKHTAPSSPKAKYLWEAFNHAKEYASEARDRTPLPLPMNKESTTKSHRHKAHDLPTTPITPATRHHSPSPEAPRTCRNSEDFYNDHKDPSHLPTNTITGKHTDSTSCRHPRIGPL